MEEKKYLLIMRMLLQNKLLSVGDTLYRVGAVLISGIEWKFSNNVPSVGLFPELKHTQFTWFGNLPTPRSYWFVLMKFTNNTNKEEENLLNSTLHSSSLYSSLFSLLSVFSLSATRRFFFSVFSRYTYKHFTGGAH
jgi:hypothetical protein